MKFSSFDISSVNLNRFIQILIVPLFLIHLLDLIRPVRLDVYEDCNFLLLNEFIISSFSYLISSIFIQLKCLYINVNQNGLKKYRR